jgi:hypothetical protein
MEAGGSEYSGLLKTRNLLIFRDAKNAENVKIAPNWNVSGTRDFQPTGQFCEGNLACYSVRPFGTLFVDLRERITDGLTALPSEDAYGSPECLILSCVWLSWLWIGTCLFSAEGGWSISPSPGTALKESLRLWRECLPGASPWSVLEWTASSKLRRGLRCYGVCPLTLRNIAENESSE